MELKLHCALSATADSIETAAAFLYSFRLHAKAPLILLALSLPKRPKERYI